jgi:hypothetical protein
MAKRRFERWGGGWGVACFGVAFVGMPTTLLVWLYYSGKHPKLLDSEGLNVSDMPMPDRLYTIAPFAATIVGVCVCMLMSRRAFRLDRAEAQGDKDAA